MIKSIKSLRRFSHNDFYLKEKIVLDFFIKPTNYRTYLLK
jgi:hypothetical protein